VLVPAGELADEVQREISDALNVKRFETVTSLEGLLDYSVVPNFRVLGPKVGKLMPKVKEALARADGAAVRHALETGGEYVLAVDGTEVRIGPDDVEVRAASHEEFALAQDGGIAVALDTRVDHDLRLEGLARELVRALNERRKAEGLEISDRIRAWLGADGDVAEAVTRHQSWIAGEVLAHELHLAAETAGEPIAVDGARVQVRIEKA
jgi:isoleucyl-tRNA synthetase